MRLLGDEAQARIGPFGDSATLDAKLEIVLEAPDRTRK
jgi:hypothetical protein